MKNSSVSVVIPCFNEEEAIENAVRSCYDEIVSKIDDSELVVVDDCSTDNTSRILLRLMNKFPKLRVIKPDKNGGHGKAVRLGYEAAKKDWVFQTDSDNQFEFQDFWKLYSCKDRHNFILGIRQNRNDPLHRLMLARIVRLTNQVLFGTKINDANCPFRLIEKQTLHSLIEAINKDAVAPNILLSILAKKKGVQIKEVPVLHHKRKTGKVSIANLKLLKICIKGFKQLLELRGSLDRNKTKTREAT